MSTVHITPEIVRELLEKQSESLLEAIKLLLKSSPVPAPAADAPAEKTKKTKKPKKERDPDAPKKPANAWILFTQRVEPLVRAAEEAAGVPKESRIHTTAVKQFCSFLKESKAYTEWTDEDIQTAFGTWTPPEKSKQAMAKEASESGSDAGSASDGEEKPKKRRGPKKLDEMTPEERAAHDQKKAERKAKKEAEKAAGAAAAPAEKPAEPAAAAPAPAPAAKKPIAAKKVAAKPKQDPAVFKSWEHEGETYYKNCRGDVVDLEQNWVGRWDAEAEELDAEFALPDDLESMDLRFE